MDPGSVAPMIVTTTLILVTGVVILLRPISKRLGLYLEVLAEQHRQQLNQPQPLSREDATRLAGVLESMEERLARLEESQAFTEKLLVERPTVHQ